jgi:uncharacterized protein
VNELRSHRHLFFIALAVGLYLLQAAALAAPSFPKLSGRVVDRANLLSSRAEQQLDALLAKHEQASGEQVVVVTLRSLQGYDIADYGYQLGRHWGIGQAGEDNGVLFIVAPAERKTRIEVGYGLEGKLTDALSKQIIDFEVIPYFKRGDFEQGIVNGTRAIIKVLGGAYDVKAARKRASQGVKPHLIMYFMLVAIAIVLGAFLGQMVRTSLSAGLVFLGTTGAGALLAGSLGIGLLLGGIAMLLHLFNQMAGMGGGGGFGGGMGGGYYGGRRGYGGWSGGGGFGGGGGFSGGGGSFGGGGASGGW